MRRLMIQLFLSLVSAGFCICGPPSPVPGEKETFALFAAVRRGDAREVEASLKRGVNANARNEDGDTPLQVAALSAGAKVMRILLEHGADPNVKDKTGGTPLMRAVGDFRKVKLLLDRGADINLRSQLGFTALMVAANTAGASAVVKVLLGHNADPNGTDNRGTPPLMYAADSDLETLTLLLTAAADVNASRVNGSSALLWAAQGPRGTLPVLMEHGATANVARIRDGLTPLIVAARSGLTENVRILLGHGAEVNAKTGDGWTALIAAVYSDAGSPELVKLLLDRGADPTPEKSKLPL